MHWIDRGPEPRALRQIRERYTPRWVAYYRESRGRKPKDSHWRKFKIQLSSAFYNLCGYCESHCRGEVDHFSPKQRFPEKVYIWTNWIFSCHDCNNTKRDKWPTGGYVNPCASSRSANPESYFDFDFKVGMVVPKKGLRAVKRRKAENTIHDLELNAFHHVKRRIQWISLVSTAFGSFQSTDLRREGLKQKVAARNYALSSFARAYFVNIGEM